MKYLTFLCPHYTEDIKFFGIHDTLLGGPRSCIVGSATVYELLMFAGVRNQFSNRLIIILDKCCVMIAITPTNVIYWRRHCK